jgi:hypothetical protein
MTPAFVGGERLQAIFMYRYPNLSDWMAPTWPFTCMALMVIVLELCLAFGMPFSRTRRYLVWPGLLLHRLFYVFLPVQTYSITIMLLYLAYYDPNQVHRVIDQLSGVAIARVPATGAR